MISSPPSQTGEKREERREKKEEEKKEEEKKERRKGMGNKRRFIHAFFRCQGKHTFCIRYLVAPHYVHAHAYEPS